MKYPESRADALNETLEDEAAIAALVELCLELWLPLAQDAILAAVDPPPPDATAVADVSTAWDYLVDALIIYGVYLLAANALDAAYTAITTVQLKAGEILAETALALIPPWPGLPTRDELATRARTVLGRVMDVDAVTRRLDESPDLVRFAGQTAETTRGRIADIVGRVHDETVRSVQDEPTNDAARADVAEELAPAEWSSLGAETAQTQTTFILNAATAEAARIAQREFDCTVHQTWTSILDSHTRPAHVVADGQTVEFGETFDVGGEPLRYPADPRGSIDNTINCRCRVFVTVTGLIASSLATLGDDERTPAVGKYRSFESVLAVIGTATDDGRIFDDNIAFEFRDFPLPLMWQKQSSYGHVDSFTVGVIESASVKDKQIVGSGYMLDTTEATEAMGEIAHGVTAPSVDLGSVEWEFRDDQGNPVSDEDWWDNPDLKIVEAVTAAKLLGATLVSIPAFGETSITLGADVDRGEDAEAAAAEIALVAAAATQRFARPVYKAEHFSDPKFTEPTLPHITDDGRIQGHLAAWNVCHTGIADRCQLAPRSSTDYAWFHTSPPVATDEGKNVKVGRLTVVTDTTKPGHADRFLSAAPAIAHYDNVGTAYALVHVGEDEHGIWFSGVAAPGASAEKIQMGLAAPISGDWRHVGGSYELVAALAVNGPGFPIIASGASDELDNPISLVASFGPACAQASRRAPVSAEDIARAVVAEMRAADRRAADAVTLVAAMERHDAARALISEMEG